MPAGSAFAVRRHDPLYAFGAKNGVDEQREARGGGEMFGFEVLRVGEMVAELFDIACQSVSFAARREAESGEM
jgi:hypothetical protein